MIAAAVFHEEALVVARCAERSVREIDLGEAVICRTSGILDAEAPRPSVLQSGHVDVAAGLNHEVAKAAAPKNIGAAIDGVAFADAAKVRKHPFPRQEHGTGRFIYLDGAIVDERQPA